LASYLLIFLAKNKHGKLSIIAEISIPNSHIKVYVIGGAQWYGDKYVKRK
jgi:hypothetical protein